MTIRFVSWNLREYGVDPHSQRQRWDQQADLIRALDPDVLAVQEICATPTGAATALARLADATGLTCSLPARYDETTTATVAVAATDFHLGLLWRPGIQPTPGGWRPYGRDNGGLWHCLATLVLDVGTPIRFGSYHADPFRPHARLHEAYRVLSAMNSGDVPGIVAGDWNNISADTRNDTGDYYDHDPYTDPHLPWFDNIIFQLEFTADPDGPRRADRSAAELLRRGRLYDAPAVLDTPWTPTTGHWPTDHHPPRRVDTHRVTHHFLNPGALTAHHVSVDGDTLSDHRPVILDINPTVLPGPAPA